MNFDHQNNNRGKGGGNNKRNITAIVSIILWALVLTVLVNYATSMFRQANSVEISYGTFRELVKEDCVAGVLMESNKYTIYLKDGVSVDANGNITKTATAAGLTGEQEETTVPPPSQWSSSGKTTYFCAPITQVGVRDDALIDLLEEHDVTQYGPEYVEELNPIVSMLISWVLPMVVMVLLFSFLFRNMAGKMGGGLGNLGKSNAKVYVEKKTGVTFKDVAGQDEAKESLVEIIDFLHNPQKYTEIGAKLPKGALLVGPPGTGKTLLAKAVAGEANVPFFSISGSDFVEMFVGVGASRVRDLFKEASKVAPCIVFIDEIDTIGKSRDNRMGGNDEREQTLNQLLAEMDGFDPTKGVILLAATNRPEVLDQALLRPGRFDRRITIDRPNLAGRLATLQVHTRKIRLAEDVDLNKIAQATAGCVGADLANMVNEAALRAVRLGRHAVNQEDLLVSFEVVIAGTEKKGTVITEQEKRIIAYHEVGHALAAAKQKNAQPVTKITIVPHTEGALGYTLHLPEEEKFLMSKEDILTEIRTLLAGRCAEELVFDTKTSGAANDIERATELARNLVARFGMSDKFGMMALGSVQSQYLDGGYSMNCAQETFAAADREVVELLQRCHDEAIELLRANREMLEAIAAYLLKKETITGQEMMAILEGRDPEQEEYYGVKSVQDNTIEAPAKHIHMTSEPIAMPAPAEEAPKAEEESADPQ